MESSNIKISRVLSFYQKTKSKFFSFPQNLLTIYIWLRKCHVTHFLLPLLQLPSLFIEINVRCVYDTDIFLFQLCVECVPCVFLRLLTRALPPTKFPLQQRIIHQKIEMSGLLQRWKAREIIWNQVLYSHCQSSPAHLDENSIKSHNNDSADCYHIPYILPLLFSMTHWERSFTVTVRRLTITFLKSASFRGKGMGDNEQPWPFPREPCQNMMPRNAVRAAEMAFSFTPAGQMWQTERGVLK